jgi:hypothetical protein
VEAPLTLAIGTALAAELAKPSPSLYPALDVTLKSAAGIETEYRLAEAGGLVGVADTSAIPAIPRVLSWGSCSYGFEALASSIGQAATTSVTVADDDRYVWQLLEAGRNRKQPAEISLICPAITTATGNAIPRFAGIIDGWGWDAGTTTIKLASDARPLETTLPVVELQRSDWNALTASTAQFYGTMLPIVIGSHQSGGLTGKGMVRCVPVAWTSTTVGWYCVAAHACKSIDAVYVNGTTKTLTTHYTVSLASVGGKTFHLIKFTTGNIPAETDDVTADVHGFENVGDGSGTMEVNPVRQLRALLVNFVFGRWLTGTYPSTSVSALLDEAKWLVAADVADRLHLEGAIHVGGTTERTKAVDIVEAWLETWQQFRMWWTPLGQLGIAHFSLTHPGYRTTQPVVWNALEKELSVESDSSGCADVVSAQHLYGQKDQTYFGSFRVFNPDADEQSDYGVTAECAAARAQ